jgi:uncharacterized protein
MENHARYSQAIYALHNDALHVNLFVASELNWADKNLRLLQNTRFPEEETTQLVFQLASPQSFALRIRHPYWLASGKMEIKVNGKNLNKRPDESGYIEIQRKWRNKDKVDVHLPMETRMEYLPDGSPWASFVHGPIVLAAKSGNQDLKGLFADDSRMGHVASGAMIPLENTAILRQDIQAGLLTKDPESQIFKVPQNAFHQGSVDGDVTLYPFYKIHDARYQIYWPILASDKSQSFLEDLKVKDEWLLRLEAITLDQVAAGEQQPEAEHDFASTASQTGTHQHAFWRSAKDWFSYTLKNPGRQGKTLRITYASPYAEKPFRILINGHLLVSELLQPGAGDQVLIKDYDISAFTQESLTIRFESIDGFETEKIKHVRLMK